MATRRPLIASSAPWSPSRRSFLGLGALGVGGAALGLAGCGGSSGASSDPNEFVFTFWGSGDEKTAVSKVINESAKAAGLKGDPQSITANYETKLNTLIAANTPPDAGYLTESMAMRLGEQGKLVNVAGEAAFADYLPGALHWYSASGAVAQSCQEAITFYVDTEALSQAGVTYPTTADTAWSWDELVQNADKLTVDSNGRHPSESGFNADDVQRYGFAPPTGVPQLINLLASNGVDLFNEDGTKSNLDSAEAIKVFQDLNELVTTHRVSPNPAQATTFGATAALLLQSKRVAMVMDGTWALLNFAQAKMAFDVAALPTYQEYRTLTLSGSTSLFASSKHQDFGVQLLADLADPSKVDLYSIGLWMPAIQSFYTDEDKISQWTSGGAHPAGFRTAVIDPVLASPTAWPAYKIKDFTTISTTITNAVGPIVSTPGDVTSAVKQLAATVNSQMKGAYPDTKPA